MLANKIYSPWKIWAKLTQSLIKNNSNTLWNSIHALTYFNVNNQYKTISDHNYVVGVCWGVTEGRQLAGGVMTAWWYEWMIDAVRCGAMCLYEGWVNMRRGFVLFTGKCKDKWLSRRGRGFGGLMGSCLGLPDHGWVVGKMSRWGLRKRRGWGLWVLLIDCYILTCLVYLWPRFVQYHFFHWVWFRKHGVECKWLAGQFVQ